MPNFTLTKDDGRVLSLPADSVTAIVSLKLDPSPEHPAAKSLIFSTFQGFSVHFLAHDASEAQVEIAKARKKKGITIRARPEWLTVDHDGDRSFFDPEAVQAFEGVGEEGEAERLRVHFTRHDGQPSYVDASNHEGNIQTLTDEFNRRK